MRRKEKEIKDFKSIEKIILKAKVCRLGLSLNNTPYIVPLSFGYKDKTIYLHCAKQGKKVDILKQNNNVCFEFDIGYALEVSEKACDWGIKFQSVIGLGTASFIENIEAKREGLDIIMQNYTDKTFEFPEKNVNGAMVIKIDIEEISGKQSGY